MDMERAAGAVNAHLPGILKDFDDFACAYGLKDTSVSESFITDWLKTRINESERTVYNKVSVWRKLLTLMNRRGCKCYVPRAMRRPHSTFTPYVFTESEYFWCDKIALV
ncbi:hypothetical protein [Bacteroides caecimuris]|uniref:hypothetical protein n=2 Tax=Bacteroidales TaxID=171549 RepID=UPI0026E927C9|nr:hypothetical protein [Bacteroides caecimuris]